MEPKRKNLISPFTVSRSFGLDIFFFILKFQINNHQAYSIADNNNKTAETIVDVLKIQISLSIPMTITDITEQLLVVFRIEHCTLVYVSISVLVVVLSVDRLLRWVNNNNNYY